MFLTEYINFEDNNRKLYNWGQVSSYKLKNEYKNPYASEVKTYKLTKEELEKELKRIYKK